MSTDQPTLPFPEFQGDRSTEQPKNSKPCPECGDWMHRQSKTCRRCHFQRIAAEKVEPRRCPVCKFLFRPTLANLKRGHGIHCSKRCSRSGKPRRKRQRFPFPCATCGKVVDRRPSDIKKTKGDKFFCSTACWYEHNQGENHYGWEGGQHDRMNPQYAKWRRAVLRRDQKRCRLCYSTEDLQAHHIKRFATHPECRWEASNGVMLCKFCHKRLRGQEEQHEAVLALMAGTPFFYCQTLDDVYKAVRVTCALPQTEPPK